MALIFGMGRQAGMDVVRRGGDMLVLIGELFANAARFEYI